MQSYLYLPGEQATSLLEGQTQLRFKIPTLHLSRQAEGSLKQALVTPPFTYQPRPGHCVIGRVVALNSEHYTVDIGSSLECTLGILEFEGATKKNRPLLEVGALVFCVVTECSKWMRGRVSCRSETQSRQWMTGESMFGELKGGVLFRRGRNWKALLDRLKKYEGMQYAKGDNGLVWAKSGMKTMAVLEHLARTVRDLDQDQLDRLLLQVGPALV